MVARWDWARIWRLGEVVLGCADWMGPGLARMWRLGGAELGLDVETGCG